MRRHCDFSTPTDLDAYFRHLETVLERQECRSGFLGPPCVNAQSNQP